MNSQEKNVTARLATIKDLPALLEVEQSAFPKERWASESTLKLRLELSDAATWVALVEDKAVGFANGFPIGDFSTQEELDPPDSELYQKGSSIWLFRNIAVHPEFQKIHIAKLLFNRQLQSAQSYGAKVVRLTTTETLSPVAGFLGFIMIQEPKLFHGISQGVWELKLR